MSLSYSTIAIGITLHNGKQPNVEYNLNGLSTADGVLNAFNSLGIIAFACVPLLHALKCMLLRAAGRRTPAAACVQHTPWRQAHCTLVSLFSTAVGTDFTYYRLL